jgi:hypothetical protein
VIAAGTTVVAAMAVGIALLWPTTASSQAGRPASSTLGNVQAAAVINAPDATTPDTTLADAHHQRSATLAASFRAIRLRFEAEQARKAAERRAAAAAAARAAAGQQAQQQTAQQAQPAQPPAASAPPSVPAGSAQQIASAMLSSFGWGRDQFSCLDALWSHESGWSTTAANPNTGAYGIPQALPGSKMASAGADWQTDAATQIRWGLGYIRGLYGSPCGAWSHEQATGWY